MVESVLSAAAAATRFRPRPDEAGRDAGETTESFSQRTRLTLENL